MRIKIFNFIYKKIKRLNFHFKKHKFQTIDLKIGKKLNGFDLKFTFNDKKSTLFIEIKRFE